MYKSVLLRNLVVLELLHVGLYLIQLFYTKMQEQTCKINSEHSGYAQIWAQLKALLFWKGDTGNIDD